MRTSASLLSSDLNANPHPIEIVGSGEENEMNEQLKKRIAERAYELYEAAGRSSGHDQEHWLRAERETVQRITQIRESGSWIIINLDVPDVPAEGFKLLITEERAWVEVEAPMTHPEPSAGEKRKHLFYMAEWRAPIEPATASAYLKNGVVTLEVKLRANPAPAKTKPVPAQD